MQICPFARLHNKWSATDNISTGVTASGVRGRRFLAVLWPKTVEIVRAGLKKRHIRVGQKTCSQNMPPILVIYIMRFTEELCEIMNP